jgi:hypothetical protein
MQGTSQANTSFSDDNTQRILALNLEELLIGQISSSPSCLRQTKRSQPITFHQPNPKIPRIFTDLPVIPINFNTTSELNQSQKKDQITEYIFQARDLLLKACSSCKAHDRQSRLLDLLEIFREYTEFGRVRHTSTLLASQIANLEKATQRIEKQAKAPIQTKPPIAPIQPTPQTTNQRPIWASIAEKQKEDWNLVSKKKASKSPEEKDKLALSRRCTLL